MSVADEVLKISHTYRDHDRSWATLSTARLSGRRATRIRTDVDPRHVDARPRRREGDFVA
jgi:hypothetical protein